MFWADFLWYSTFLERYPDVQKIKYEKKKYQTVVLLVIGGPQMASFFFTSLKSRLWSSANISRNF